MNNEEASVRITLTAIYAKLLEVEAKVSHVPETLDDHETRLRTVEKYLWLWLGSAAVAGGAVSQVGGHLIGG